MSKEYVLPKIWRCINGYIIQPQSKAVVISETSTDVDVLINGTDKWTLPKDQFYKLWITQKEQMRRMKIRASLQAYHFLKSQKA
jgi:hypothetical protein